jgi:REP-associated tyrosine transposase
MQWLMTSHVRRYHKHYGTSGHVWQGRYKSFIVQDNDHLLTVARYIEANPVRAGLSATAAQWPWSSHAVRSAATESLRPDILPIALPDDWAVYVDNHGTLYKCNTCDKEILDYYHKVASPYGSSELRL